MSITAERPATRSADVDLVATRRPIIVGVDSSPASTGATEWAAAEAASRHVPLHIVHTWTWQHLAPWSTSADRMVKGDLHRAGQKLVNHCRSLARKVDDLEVTTEVREGPAGRVLIDLSRGAGLIVVGTRHLGPMGRAVLGSASGALVARAECPTVVVSTHSRVVTTPASAVVVGLAATPEDKQVLEFAFDYAQRHELPLQALFCWYTGNLPMNQMRIPERAGAWLSESLAGWREEYPDVQVGATVREVPPVAGLVNAAGPHNLIVVGRRARKTRAGAHLGSVSLGILHHATGSVAVVPS